MCLTYPLAINAGKGTSVYQMQGLRSRLCDVQESGPPGLRRHEAGEGICLHFMKPFDRNVHTAHHMQGAERPEQSKILVPASVAHYEFV